MKKNYASFPSYLLLCYFLFASNLQAQSPHWDWASSSSGTGGSYPWSCTTDVYGNFLVTGFYADTLSIGPYNLVSPLSSSFFVAKFDTAGQVLWVKTAVATSASWGSRIATDAQSNVYIAGRSDTLMSFDDVSIIDSSITFLVKYDASGNVLWANGCQAVGNLAITGLSVNKSGNLYALGFMSGDTTIIGDSTYVGSYYNQQIALIKYDPSGRVIWSKVSGGAGPGVIGNGWGITTNENSDVFISGYFYDTLSFGTTSMISAGQSDFFMARFDSSGNLIWAKSWGGSESEVGYGIALDGYDNIYVTGYFTSDSVNFGGNTLYLQGNSSAFIGKYDDMGNLLWIKSPVTRRGSLGNSISADRDGHVYFCGDFFTDSITFDSTLVILSPPLFDPLCLATFDSAGNLICAGVLGCGGNSGCSAIDNFGNAYVCATSQFAFSIGADSVPYTTDIEFPGNLYAARYNCGVTISAVNGIEDLSGSMTLQIYPNPFSGQAAVDYSLPAGSKNAKLMIYDMLGRPCNSYTLNNVESKTYIQAGNLCSGVYFCSLVVDGRVLVTRRMVVIE